MGAVKKAQVSHNHQCRYVRMPELLDELGIALSAGELKKCLVSYKKVGQQ